MNASFAFEGFVLNTSERWLRLGDETVELSGRYLDALALLVSEPGKLISKERFLEEVWRGIPVTDEALTQCIKMLRRQLGDDAANPRFIETVPKHGYRFIAAVDSGDPPSAKRRQSDRDFGRFVETGVAGTLGGAIAGMLGGLAYGLLGAAQGPSAGVGGVSILLVLVALTVFVSLVGAAGVSFSIGAAQLVRPPSWRWTTIGGAAGGLLTGAFAKLLGLDAFTLLVGRAPQGITGAMEGMWLGAAVGLASAIARRPRWKRRAPLVGAIAGAAAGLVIASLGGRLMLGSLELVGQDMPGSRLHFDWPARLFSETGFGPLTAAFANASEGALFSACVVTAMMIGERWSRARNGLARNR